METKKNLKMKEKLLTLIIFFLFIIKTSLTGLDSFILILDTGNNRVQKFDIEGNFLLNFGSKGIGASQFNYPAGIAISSDTELIYVADTANNRIQVFDKNGNFIKIFLTQTLSNPNSLAVNNEQEKDFIYIADTGHNCILKYDYKGEFIYMLGKLQAGNKDGEFNNPQGVTANKNFVFVSDTGNHRIQKFDLNGNFLLKWGSQGKDSGKFNYPRDIAVDDRGFVYVVDSQNYRVQKFTEDGKFILEWGKKGTAEGEFNGHFGIAVDEKNFIYVADAGNNRVQKFTDEGNWLKTYGTITKSAEPGLFYYPQGIEISYLKIFNTETPTLTFTPTYTETNTIMPTEILTSTPINTETNTIIPTEIFTSTPTNTEIPTQIITEENTPISEITPVENPGKCEFVKLYEIKWNFLMPRCITIDKKENIYIFDFLSKDILKFNKNGYFIKKVKNKINDIQPTPQIPAENVEYEIGIIERNENTEVSNSSEEENQLFITSYSNEEIKKVNLEGKILTETELKIPDNKIVGNFAFDRSGKFYMANAYKGEIKIFNAQGYLLKNIKIFRKFFLISKILADDNGVIYLIDKISRKIYRIIENGVTLEVYDFNFKHFLKYLYFIKNNYLYVAEIDKNKIIIYKLLCSYETKQKEQQRIEKKSDYNILMYDKDKIIIKNNDMDEKEIYNYPNPCNGITTIRFITYKKQDIKIIIYNVNGKIVWQKILYANEVKDGLNEIVFNGKNENGIALNNGVYLYKIIANDKIITKKMVIMK